jgi:hypothetical protein
LSRRRVTAVLFSLWLCLVVTTVSLCRGATREIVSDDSSGVPPILTPGEQSHTRKSFGALPAYFEPNAKFAIGRHGRIKFKLGAYDSTKQLVIDPLLVFSTYFGGSGEDDIEAMTACGGDICVTGRTNSISFPVVHFCAIANVARLSSDGPSLPEEWGHVGVPRANLRVGLVFASVAFQSDIASLIRDGS